MSDAMADIAAKVAAAVGEKTDPPPKSEPEPKREPIEAPVIVSEPEETPEVSPAQQARAEAESTARERGWVSKDEWIEAGKDEDDWVPAKRFLKIGDEIEERKELKKQLKETRKLAEELTGLVKKGLATQAQKEVLAKMAQRDQAIELGDKAKVHELDKEIASVKAEATPEVTPAEIMSFVQENKEWWGVDLPATQAAVVYYGSLEAKNRDDVSGNLAKTKRHLALRFPDLFPGDRADAAEAAQAMSQQQPVRKLSSVTVQNSGAAPAKRGKQWSDLPAGARHVAEKICDKTGMTKEQYLQTYQWD